MRAPALQRYIYSERASFVRAIFVFEKGEREMTLFYSYRLEQRRKMY